MAQHDYVISNGTGAAVRSDLNNALLAIVSQNSGATEPTTTYAYQWWADTTTGLLKIRNSANNAWITLRELDGTLTVEDGTVSAPGLAFRDDLNTGIWRPGTDQFAISTNGVERVEWGTSEVVFNDAGNNYDFRIEGDNNANLLFVDASADAVGIGTSSPASLLHSVGTTILGTGTYPTGSIGLSDARTAILSSTENQILVIGNTNATVGADKGAEIYLGAKATTGSENLAFAKIGGFKSNATSGNFESHLTFNTSNSVGTSSEKVRIDSSGRVGIGTTAPTSNLSFGATDAVISADTSDASDNKSVSLAGGGAAATTRGGYVQAYGNEYTTTGGVVDINSGNVANSYVRIQGRSSTSDIRFWINGAESARIDSSGRMLVGTSTAATNYRIGTSSFTPIVQVEGTSPNVSPLAIQRTDGAPYLYIATGVNVSSGSQIGYISFNAKDGTNLVQAAQIGAECDGTPGTNDMPGRLVFSTTADAASSPTERFRIDSTGYLRAVGTSGTARIIPHVDNVGYVGQSSERWQAIYAVNGTIQTSDRRQKTDITEALLGSDFIKTLKPVSYKWIEGGKEPTGEIDENGDQVFTSIPGQRTHWGFIAQDVKEAVDAAGVDFGGWLLDDKDDPNSQQALRYDQFIAPLTKALQEALAEIDVLKSKVAALESA